MLQAHNPNYLKGSSPTSSRKNGSDDLHEAYDNIDEIPIAELNLDVPLKVHCKLTRLFDTESNESRSQIFGIDSMGGCLQKSLEADSFLLKFRTSMWSYRSSFFVHSENSTGYRDLIECRTIFLYKPLLTTPPPLTAKKRSDKYLEESRRAQKKEKKAEKSSKKNKKKSKKSKPDLHSDSDSDEPKPLHVVNTTIEMPEGAVVSDNDDKNDLDVNDPHRALDIDLEADDDFYAPPKSSKKAAAPEAEPAKTKDKSSRKKKEPEPALLMEKTEESSKKEKKKHKRKKESAEVDLLGVAAAEKKEKKSKKKSHDDEKPKKHKKSSTKKNEYEEAFGQEAF